MRLRQRAKSIKIPIKRTRGGIQKPYTEKKIEYMPKKDKQYVVQCCERHILSKAIQFYTRFIT